MRAGFSEALEDAKLDVVRLGALSSDAIHSAVNALEKRDVNLAAHVIAGDDQLDELARGISASCLELIWRQQPVAGDLRQVAAMLQIAIDLERVGDYASSIAKNGIKISDMPVRPARIEIGRIAALALALLRDAMRAFTERDAALSDSVIERDDELDRLYHRSIEMLEEEMQQDSAVVKSGAIMLFVLANLERVGDRAQNVAWHTKEMLGAA
jgi:phosphate transport system protein